LPSADADAESCADELPVDELAAFATTTADRRIQGD
jgi:hypothetical protein